MQVPKRRSELNVKRDTGPLLITAEGLARLEKKVERLKSELPAMIKEVERTKEHGDFSENAAYQDAKATLRRTYNRIASTEDKIKRATVIEKAPSGEVGLGSTVVLEMSGKRVTFEILGPHEANPSAGRISNQSPLGQALLGRKVGEKVSVRSAEYTIVEIK